MSREIKDRPLVMPCDDPEGCKHFKEQQRLETLLERARDMIYAYAESANIDRRNPPEDEQQIIMDINTYLRESEE